MSHYGQQKPIDLLFLGSLDFYMAELKTSDIEVNGELTITDALYNIRIGTDALASNTSATYNLAIGWQPGVVSTLVYDAAKDTGSVNAGAGHVLIGLWSGASLVWANAAIDYMLYGYDPTYTFAVNYMFEHAPLTCVGREAGRKAAGAGHVYIGTYAGAGDTVGTPATGTAIPAGLWTPNTAVGMGAGYRLGDQGARVSQCNTLVGYASGITFTGDCNCCVGAYNTWFPWVGAAPVAGLHLPQTHDVNYYTQLGAQPDYSNVTANMSGSTVLGYAAYSTAANSVSIGRTAYCTAATSVAVGYGASATGASGIAIGNGCTAAASGLAVGLSATAAANVARIGASNQYSTFYVGCTGITFDSDRRIKDEIDDIDPGVALDFMAKLRPRTYKLKQHFEPGKKAGFIAQEVRAVQPENVPIATFDRDDHWYMEYQNLHAYSVSAIQSLMSENNQLKDRVAKLELMVQQILNAK